MRDTEVIVLNVKKLRSVDVDLDHYFVKAKIRMKEATKPQAIGTSKKYKMRKTAENIYRNETTLKSY